MIQLVSGGHCFKCIDDTSVFRTTEPLLHANENVGDVNYHMLIMNKSINRIQYLRETYKMRYLFIPEIYDVLHYSGLKSTFCNGWMERSEENRLNSSH